MSNKAIFSLLVLLISVSCQKDSVPGTGGGDKSIVCSVSVLGGNDTKSVEVDSESLRVHGNTFRMDAWLEKENRGAAWPEFNDNPHYIKDAIMKYDGDTDTGKWKSSDTNVVWTNQIQTNFWAQYPESVDGRGTLTWTAAVRDSITDEEERKPSFTYNLLTYVDSVSPYPGRASKVTRDLLVAYATEQYKLGEEFVDKKLNFKFAHVLSAIKFINDGYQEGSQYLIDTILITGVCSYGTCYLTGLPRTETSLDSVSVSWIEENILSDGKCFSQITDEAYWKNKEYIFMIPQYLTNSAILKAHISINPGGGGSTDKEGWYDGYLEGISWKPGYIYNYSIGFDPKKQILRISVDDSCEKYKTQEGKWNPK